MTSFASVVSGFRPGRFFAVVAVAASVAFAAGPASAQPNFEINPNLGIQLLPDRQLQPSPQITTVHIQGGGLQWLDAHEDANNDYNVVLRPFQNNSSQEWRMIPVSGDIYRFQQVNTGRYLDAHEIGGAQYDFRVVTRPLQDFDQTQLWRVTNFGGGFVTIQQVSSGRFLEATYSNDGQVVTRPNAAAPAAANSEQEWRLGS